MREILFRGKREDNGVWLIGSLWCNDTIIEQPVRVITEWIMEEGVNTAYQYRVKADTIGQYTGLKDKNGVKIFENDIVEVDVSDARDGYVSLGKKKYICIWDRTHHRFVFNVNLKNSIYTFWNYPNANYTNINVIGNIHDNPELLED